MRVKHAIKIEGCSLSRVHTFQHLVLRVKNGEFLILDLPYTEMAVQNQHITCWEIYFLCGIYSYKQGPPITVFTHMIS